MLDSSLIETLSKLKTAELERLHKFVHSPYFNDGPYARDVIALWEFLRPYAPAFDQPDTTVERAYQSIYPGKAFVKGKLEVLMSKWRITNQSWRKNSRRFVSMARLRLRSDGRVFVLTFVNLQHLRLGRKGHSVRLGLWVADT